MMAKFIFLVKVMQGNDKKTDFIFDEENFHKLNEDNFRLVISLFYFAI